MVTLMLSCHHCHHAFPSGVSLDRKGDRSRPIDGLVYECPRCGTRDAYFTSEQHPLSPNSTSVGRISEWGGRGSLPLPLSLIPRGTSSRSEAGEGKSPSSMKGFLLAAAGGVAAGVLGTLLVMAAFHGAYPGEFVVLPW